MMPAFSDWPEEAKVIARILAGYGELEFRLAKLVGYAMSRMAGNRTGVDRDLDGHRMAPSLLFHRRGEEARLELAHLLVGDEMRMVDVRLGNLYDDAKDGMDECRLLRNMLAHCHFGSLKHGQPTDGLFFVSLESKAVKQKRDTKMVKQKRDPIQLLWQSASCKRPT
jgi:hypothetical protein